MEIIGQVISKGLQISNEYKRIFNYDIRKSTITARLLSHSNLRVGDTIYVVRKDPNHEKYKNGFIIAKGEIFSVFETEFQGWLLKAKGYFSHVQEGFFIAKDKIDDMRKEAYVLLKKGDRARLLKSYAEAFSYYQRSLEYDAQRPETYLKLAALNKELNLPRKTGNYVEEAWKRLNNFEDVNSFLELPGIYLKWQNKNINDHTSQKIRQVDCSHTKKDDQFACKRLKYALYILNEIRQYKKNLDIFRYTLSSSILELLETKGVPDYEFQYNFARLMLTLHDILGRYSPRKVVHWLVKKEREILYQRIVLAYKQGKVVEPKRAWDKAYLEAALYHLELAHELNSLDPRAAIKIVEICYNELSKNPPRLKKHNYLSIAKHYGRKLKGLFQLKGYNWDTVRSMLDRISQL